jgi:regulator of replication initiation timing
VLTDETDQWFKETHDHLTEVEQLLNRLYVSFRLLSGDHKELSKSMSALKTSLSRMALSEENTILSLMLDKLAEMHSTSSTIENYNADMTVSLVQNLADQIQSIKVRHVFYTIYFNLDLDF